MHYNTWCALQLLHEHDFDPPELGYEIKADWTLFYWIKDTTMKFSLTLVC